MMNEEVLFRSPTRKLWKTRALPAFILGLGAVFALFLTNVFLTGGVDPEGYVLLLVAFLGTALIGYYGIFSTNRLAVTTTHVAPPGKPLSRLSPRRLLIAWRDVEEIELTRGLVTRPEGVSYAFTIRGKDGRAYPFEAMYVAWLTESTREMRRVYEMMNEISDALKRQRLETLDADKRLMTRLREIQKADYPEFDLFSRTAASKLAMIVGGPLLLAGVLIVLLKVPTHPLLAASLWIVGGLVFGLGLSTKRALPGWGKKGRSAGL